MKMDILIIYVALLCHGTSLKKPIRLRFGMYGGLEHSMSVD